MHNQRIWAFPRAERYLCREGYPSEGLKNYFNELDKKNQSNFIIGMVRAFRWLAKNIQDSFATEHLLYLASNIRAEAIIVEIERMIVNDFYSLTTKNNTDSRLCGAICITLGKLSNTNSQDTLTCCTKLLESKAFEFDYSGLVLSSMCIADPNNWRTHIVTAKDGLLKMFNKYQSEDATANNIADLLSGVTKDEILSAFSMLKK